MSYIKHPVPSITQPGSFFQLLSQVDQLKEENVRLQEESQTAAQQLRRFTEWFFQTIDKS